MPGLDLRRRRRWRFTPNTKSTGTTGAPLIVWRAVSATLWTTHTHTWTSQLFLSRGPDGLFQAARRRFPYVDQRDVSRTHAVTAYQTFIRLFQWGALSFHTTPNDWPIIKLLGDNIIRAKYQCLKSMLVIRLKILKYRKNPTMRDHRQ